MHQFNINYHKGLSTKDVRTPEEGVCPVRTRKGGSSNVEVRTFLRKKTRILRNLSTLCPHGQEGRGLSLCGHFSDKEGGINFSRFCADVLYGGP